MIIVPALRTGAQVLLGYLLTYALAHGVHISLAAQNWFIETLMVGGGVALYTLLVRWLETNHNPALRLLGHVLMLGLGTLQPTGYASPADIQATQDAAGDHSLDAHPDSDPSTVRPDLPVE